MQVKVEVYIPKDYVTGLANDLNSHDYLQEGYYDYAFSTTLVKGHWRPLEGAQPYEGEVGLVTEADEIKMEFVVQRENLEDILHIIRRIHPYESPAVNCIALLDPDLD